MQRFYIQAVLFSVLLPGISFAAQELSMVTMQPAVMLLNGSRGIQVSETYLKPGWFFGKEWQGIGVMGKHDQVNKSASSVNELAVYFSTTLEETFRSILPAFLAAELKAGLGYLQKKEFNNTKGSPVLYLAPELHLSLPSFDFFYPDIFFTYSASIGASSLYFMAVGSSLAFKW